LFLFKKIALPLKVEENNRDGPREISCREKQENQQLIFRILPIKQIAIIFFFILLPYL
tara:strand:+ start:816 stop:989 length:174 start_codon:yes stop_codon:yes gene_type:complete